MGRRQSSAIGESESVLFQWRGLAEGIRVGIFCLVHDLLAPPAFLLDFFALLSG